jgi:hypothetical protein
VDYLHIGFGVDEQDLTQRRLERSLETVELLFFPAELVAKGSPPKMHASASLYTPKTIGKPSVDIEASA